MAKTKWYPDAYQTRELISEAIKAAEPGWYIRFDVDGNVCGACLLGQTALLAGLDPESVAENFTGTFGRAGFLDDYPFDIPRTESLDRSDFGFAIDQSAFSLNQDTCSTIRHYVSELYPTVGDIRKAILKKGYSLRKQA